MHKNEPLINVNSSLSLQYIKMEELAEQESVLMRTIQARGGIVQNLLNWTTKNEDMIQVSSEIDREKDLICDQ